MLRLVEPTVAFRIVMTFFKQDIDGCTPFFLACYSGHPESAELLKPLHFMPGSFNMIFYKWIISNVQNNSTDNSGRTELHVACQNNHLDVVVFLIDQGVSLNETDSQGMSQTMVGKLRLF